jgi:hypothetical protein
VDKSGEAINAAATVLRIRDIRELVELISQSAKRAYPHLPADDDTGWIGHYFESKALDLIRCLHVLEPEEVKLRALEYLWDVLMDAFLIGTRDFASLEPLSERLLSGTAADEIREKALAEHAGKYVTEHSRKERSLGPREHATADAIAAETTDWDGKKHFAKAVEIHGAIKAALGKAWEAWVKNGRKGKKRKSSKALDDLTKGIFDCG